MTTGTRSRPAQPLAGNGGGPARPLPGNGGGRALALVTGASAGIGRATTRALAATGLDVIAVGRNAVELATVANATGMPSAVEPVVADVTTPEGRALIRRAVASRPLTALIHGAGVFPRGRIEALTARDWEIAFSTNVHARRDLVLDLRSNLRGGRVLFIGSDAARTARTGGAAYSISKAASEMLWRCFVAELGDEIAFGMAKPGLVATRMLEESLQAPREAFPAGDVYAAMRDRGETIAPETVARFVRFLLLEAASAEFTTDIWDIRDPGHHPRWLTGDLYLGSPSGRG